MNTELLKEIADLQTAYQALFDEKRLTKKAICDLCVPFRDRHSLTGLQTLRIARDEMSISEIAELLTENGVAAQ